MGGTNMEQITGSLDVSKIKRFQMPDTSIKITCPRCGDKIDVQLIDDQIYYPENGKKHSVAFESEKCNIEIIRKIVIIDTIVTLYVYDEEIVI